MTFIVVTALDKAPVQLQYFSVSGRLGSGNEWCTVPDELRKWIVQTSRATPDSTSTVQRVSRRTTIVRSIKPGPDDRYWSIADVLNSASGFELNSVPSWNQPKTSRLLRVSGGSSAHVVGLLKSAKVYNANGKQPVPDATLVVLDGAGRSHFLDYVVADGRIGWHGEWRTAPAEFRTWVLAHLNRPRK